MKRATAIKLGLLGVLLIAAAAVFAPFLRADGFTAQIRAAIESSLGRKVEMEDARFILFPGPGFRVSKVVIHEDPVQGLEPLAYVATLEASVRLWSLWTGSLEFDQLRLYEPSLNLVKPSSSAAWNFTPLLAQRLARRFPSIQVRYGRINFKLGDVKSVFYLLNSDLDVSPPASGEGEWRLKFTGEPARADRAARGFGSVRAEGRWSPRNLDFDLRLERSNVGEIVALVRGYDAGVHGVVSARLRVTGPPEKLRIAGEVRGGDLHRWDLSPGHTPEVALPVAGTVDLVAQTLELDARSQGKDQLPVAMKFRASELLGNPRWAIGVNWNRFPLEPLTGVARHMGAPLPDNLKLTGSLDGAIGCSSGSPWMGEVGLREAAITLPGSAPVEVREASVVFEGPAVTLRPAVFTNGRDSARIEAAYRFDTGEYELDLLSGGLDVASLREQRALAAVPVLEQFTQGKWTGRLRYAGGEWSGRVEVTGAALAVPGLAGPLEIASARVQLDGARASVDRLRAATSGVEFEGAYRYEPGAPRPHQFRLKAEKVDAAALEAALAPTLRRGRTLLARALGRAAVPAWLAERRAEGRIEIAALTTLGAVFSGVRGRAVWDGARIAIEDLHASMEDAAIDGRLAINLRGAAPAYRIETIVANWPWSGGAVDAGVWIESRGTGAELLANLHARGGFTASEPDLPSLPAVSVVSGQFEAQASGRSLRIKLTGLEAATPTELYTGRGGTQDDGKFLVTLSSPSRELRLTGPLAKLQAEP